VRALVRATRGGELDIMFPLVAETAEFNAARKLVDLEVEREKKRNGGPSKLRVGVMLEVPGLAFQLRSLLPVVAFISIGSNDLFQFMYAADRANPRTADRYDTLSPGFLTFLKSLIEECDRAKVPVAVCGEMAGRPLEAMALLGLGLRELSMPPSSVGPVKTMVRSLAIDEITPYLAGLLDSADHSLRETLKNFARDHDVALEEP
jgi:phosphotransferase system enzyme I (PtsP)